MARRNANGAQASCAPTKEQIDHGWARMADCSPRNTRKSEDSYQLLVKSYWLLVGAEAAGRRRRVETARTTKDGGQLNREGTRRGANAALVGSD